MYCFRISVGQIKFYLFAKALSKSKYTKHLGNYYKNKAKQSVPNPVIGLWKSWEIPEKVLLKSLQSPGKVLTKPWWKYPKVPKNIQN